VQSQLTPKIDTQRAKKAAADAARVEAEVIAKQMADEAEALKRAKAAAAVKVRKYTSEELAQRAANKKAIDRKREQIQMTREDHQASVHSCHPGFNGMHTM